MRLILPTGEDDAERAYPLDGLLDLGRITLNEMIELRRVTGMDIPGVQRGFGLLDNLIGVPNAEILASMSKHLELMEAYRALVWIARHRAGDRAPDGSTLTAEQAVDFPFAGLDVRPDPGDEAAAAPDPHRPPAGGGRAAGGAKRKTPAGRTKTSARKS